MLPGIVAVSAGFGVGCIMSTCSGQLAIDFSKHRKFEPSQACDRENFTTKKSGTASLHGMHSLREQRGMDCLSPAEHLAMNACVLRS